MTLSPEILVSAYMQGVFPMAHEDGQIYWYRPDPRAILPLDERFHVSRSLARTVRRDVFTMRYNTAFPRVIAACAARRSTWISDKIIRAYIQLHRLGFAHSVESWLNGKLVGGLYGVAVGGLFAGESMFHRERDASKVALVHLVERLRDGGFRLLDIQYMTDHLRRFGAIEVSDADYQERLARAIRTPARFDDPEKREEEP
jgi:leucyl/phenylalanyl-tRNA--protein transferase